MALTTPKQVLHDVKVGYIAATGDTDTITYGNIASKCNAAYGGGGGGVETTDITLNADRTYTVTDADENEHTLEITETDGQITAITYDGDNVPLTFASGLLTKVGDTDINISRYPNTPTNTIPFINLFELIETKQGGNQ